MKSITAIFLVCLCLVVPALSLKKLTKANSNSGFPSSTQAVRLYNAYKSNWVLAPESGNSFTQCQPLTNSQSELWYLIPVPNSWNNAYYIKSASTSQYLEISGGSGQNSAALAFASSFTQKTQQQFSIFDPCGNGNYVIQNVNSLLAVAADCGKFTSTSGACAVDQYAYAASAVHMRWTFQ